MAEEKAECQSQIYVRVPLEAESMSSLTQIHEETAFFQDMKNEMMVI